MTRTGHLWVEILGLCTKQSPLGLWVKPWNIEYSPLFHGPHSDQRLTTAHYNVISKTLPITPSLLPTFQFQILYQSDILYPNQLEVGWACSLFRMGNTTSDCRSVSTSTPVCLKASTLITFINGMSIVAFEQSHNYSICIWEVQQGGRYHLT